MRNFPARKVLPFAILLLTVAVGCKHPVASAPPAPPPAPPAAPPAQPTVTLSSNPTIIQRGQSTTLQWSSTNATSLSLTPGVGSVAPQGTNTVTPNDSITYTITATGPGGMAQSSTHVTVTPAPAPVSAAPQPTMEEMFAKEVQDAFFDYDKADIRADARDALSKTAQFLRSYPNVKVVVEGHCDQRGSTEYNLALGDRRAQAAKDFLVSLGVGADRMQTVSYGKERLFCTEENESCYMQNRRAHFVLAK